LALLESKIDAWVQIACPRLSVDWGHHLSTNRPVLNPYELFVCLEETPFRKNYPMDYYSEAGGPWSNYHEATKERQVGVS
jgi:2-(3-amino-3-carboxypropyl)histidine synthase